MPRGTPRPSGTAAYESGITIDPARAERKMAELTKALPDELRKELRKELAAAAKLIVTEQRKRVKGLTSKSSGGSGTNARMNATLASGKSFGPLTQRKWEGLRKRSGLRNAAAASVRVINRTRGSTNQLTVKSEPNRMPADQRKLPSHMNTGHWRHPVMGNREAWVTQTVTPGWFDKPGEEKSPEVAARVDKAIESAITKLPA